MKVEHYRAIDKIHWKPLFAHSKEKPGVYAFGWLRFVLVFWRKP